MRHAEKSTDPGGNPHLTPEGYQRAEALKDQLKDKNIAYIFSTNTTRTLETVDPLSKSINVPVQQYSNDTLENFLNAVLSLGKNVVVVGHSNTILPMLDDMHLSHSITSIPDNDYSELFIVTVKNGKAVEVKETKYGASN